MTTEQIVDHILVLLFLVGLIIWSDFMGRAKVWRYVWKTQFPDDDQHKRMHRNYYLAMFMVVVSLAGAIGVYFTLILPSF